MTFEEILDQAVAMLQRRGRVTYRTLKRQFHLDDDVLEDLKAEIIKAQRLAVDEDGEVLVWTGGAVGPVAPATEPAPAPLAYTPSHLAEKILTSRSALEGERKPVTVLFCDLVNSTPLAERLGPDAMHVLLNRFFELALAKVHRYAGTINQFLGDGFMALFGAPIAYEDHARRAVLAAIGIQRALRREVGEHSDDEGATRVMAEDRSANDMVLAALQVRMGLNTGLVVVGSIGDNLRMDYTAVGDTTNLAARLQQLAEPGTILLSETTSRLVQGYVRVQALGPIQVKGKTAPVTAYKVLGLGPRRSSLEGDDRIFSRFVDRERELLDLQELLAQVVQGQGQVVELVGEPGVGKSRLLYEFRQRVMGRQVTYLEGHCLSYGSAIPYLPILDLLRTHCGITEADSPEAIAQKVRIGLQDVGMDPEEGAPYLLQLLGLNVGTDRLAALSPEAIKARTFETLRQMSLSGSRQRPLILAVEDLHWIDRTSEAWFASLVEHLVGAPIFLLVTYRPGYRPPWLEKSYATQLALQPLSPQDSLSMVRSVLQGTAVPDPLAQVIISKAEGNPFFLEELSRAVAEQAQLRPSLAVPDTIQGVLLARIDRLPEAPKRVLQTASVLGREVPLKLLTVIWEDPGALEPHLLELKRLEFLNERIGADEPIYVFRHALTQEVVYESLRFARRQALHAAAGQALEGLYVDRLEEAYDRLAYHYARAKEGAKAIEYLTRLAAKAARSYAHTEAATALKEALALVGRLPAAEQDRCSLDLLLRLVHSLYFLGAFLESWDLLLGQRERLERLQDPTLAGPYYFWLSHTYSHMGDQERATQSAQRAIAEAIQCGDAATLGQAYFVLAREGCWSGRLVQGIEHGQKAVALLERTEERWWLGMAYWAVGITEYYLGAFEPALEAAARIQAIGEALGDLRLQAYAAWSTGLIEATRGEWEAGIAACQRSLARSPDPFLTAAVMGFLGHAHLEKGDAAQAIAALEQAVQHMSRYGYRQLHGWFTTDLSEAYRLSRQIEQARDLAIQGLEITRGAKFWYGIGLAQRALGRIAQASGALAVAKRYLSEALDTFTAIQARFEIGRTHLDLAAVVHAEGNQYAVATHLQEAHALFRALQAPTYVECTAQLARKFEAPLSEG